MKPGALGRPQALCPDGRERDVAQMLASGCRNGGVIELGSGASPGRGERKEPLASCGFHPGTPRMPASASQGVTGHQRSQCCSADHSVRGSASMRGKSRDGLRKDACWSQRHPVGQEQSWRQSPAVLSSSPALSSWPVKSSREILKIPTPRPLPKPVNSEPLSGDNIGTFNPDRITSWSGSLLLPGYLPAAWLA